MVGIIACGAYVPRYRLSRRRIFEAMGWFDPTTAGVARGYKAVANHDEDSLTMAVAAARDVLLARPDLTVDAVSLASTTLPYAERQNAAILVTALDLAVEGPVLDLGGSPRCGSQALIDALQRAAAPKTPSTLVCAADCRVGRLGGSAEHTLGDAASATMVGSEGVAAEALAWASEAADFADRWRASDARTAGAWEARWVRDSGQLPLLGGVAKRCLAQAGVEPGAVDRLLVAGVPARAQRSLGKRLGVPPEALHDPLSATVGDAGAAQPGLLLASALAKAAPGELILMLAWGSGADAVLLRTTDGVSQAVPGAGVAGHLARSADLEPYEKYVVFRDQVPVEVGIRGEAMAPTALSVLWRERDTVLRLRGVRCGACGAAHFPPTPVCVRPGCGATEGFESVSFACQQGTIFTYTADNLAFSPEPPALYGLVDFADGARLFLDFTDCTASDLKVGMAVRPSFRRKYLDRKSGIAGYFWKVVPIAQ